MEKFHVVIAYDFDSDKSDGDAWEKFKDKYRQFLWRRHDEEKYPKSTAVLIVNAQTDEEAIQIVKTEIKKWINEIKAKGTIISISKFFIACCNNEDFS